MGNKIQAVQKYAEEGVIRLANKGTNSRYHDTYDMIAQLIMTFIALYAWFLDVL